MAILDRASIVTSRKLRQQTVSVPEWGGEVRVRELTAGERDIYEASLVKRTEAGVKLTPEDSRARLVILGVCDERGEPILGEGDLAAVSQASSSAVDRVFQAILSLSGMTSDGKKEAEKN